jgi:HEPN domain-containing protein
MKKGTREWVRKAEDDHQLVEKLARDNDGLYDQLCFHGQQSAEKYLKALTEELGLPVEKTHDLERLFGRLLPTHPSLRSVRRGLAFLTQFAVGIRYPGEDANKRQATAVRRWARRVREACRAILGIPAPGRRKSP